jgi:hypothetical protein
MIPEMESRAMGRRGCHRHLPACFNLRRLLLEGKVPQDSWLLEDPSLKAHIQAYAENEEDFFKVSLMIREFVAF